jgi:DNA-binding transcriptional LysR family regulator
MDRFESMRVLVAVVDAGSLSAAGRTLGMPLATVSRKISELESDLRTRLLIRSTRRLTLTDAGHDYVAACRRILADVAETERAASGEYSAPRGDLVITAPVVFGRLHIVPVVVEFLRAYPQVNVRLALGDRAVNLLEDHVDLALRIGTLPDSSMVSTNLGIVRHLTCASPGYLAAHGAPRDPRDLVTHSCVSFEIMAAANTWPFHIAGAEIAVAIRPRLIVSTAEAAIEAAVLGAGITRTLSYQVEMHLRTGMLERLLVPFECPPVPVQFLYPGHGRLPLKLRALLDFAAARLRDRLKLTERSLSASAPRKTRGPKTLIRRPRPRH